MVGGVCAALLPVCLRVLWARVFLRVRVLGLGLCAFLSGGGGGGMGQRPGWAARAPCFFEGGAMPSSPFCVGVCEAPFLP